MLSEGSGGALGFVLVAVPAFGAVPGRACAITSLLAFNFVCNSFSMGASVSHAFTARSYLSSSFKSSC